MKERIENLIESLKDILIKLKICEEVPDDEES